MYNILVTGASGQLGSELQAIAGQYDYVFHFKNSNYKAFSSQVAVVPEFQTRINV